MNASNQGRALRNYRAFAPTVPVFPFGRAVNLARLAPLRAVVS